MLNFQSLMFEALSEDFGIEIRTNNPESLRAKLYAARKDDPTFSSLSFVIPKTDPHNLLWIIKRPEKPNAEE